jgi:hypothetical protein
MKYFQNPDNRYRVVAYYPTLDNLKEMYAGMYKNYDGGLYTFFDEAMKEAGYTSADELVTYTLDFLQVLNKTWKHFERDPYYFGLQEMETGKIIMRFYNNLYSYHPELGYVIFRKEHDRDCCPAYSTKDWIFNVVSLKTGKEYRWEFIERPSGIKDDLTLFGYTLNHQGYDTFKIDETNDELIEINIPVQWHELGKYFPEANNEDFDEFGIELIENGVPYFQDLDFCTHTSLLKSLEGLIPKNLSDVS